MGTTCVRGKLDEHTCMYGKLDEHTCMHGKLDEQARHVCMENLMNKLDTLCTFCTLTDSRVPRTGQIGRDVGGPHTQMCACICENVCHSVNTQRGHSFNTEPKRHQNVCVSISLHNGHI